MLLSRALCLQFHDVFFNLLLLHQFNVVLRGSCEDTIHVIWTTLDICLDLMVFQVHIVNAFNTILRKVIF
jgi:hypothetical protein